MNKQDLNVELTNNVEKCKELKAEVIGFLFFTVFFSLVTVGATVYIVWISIVLTRDGSSIGAVSAMWFPQIVVYYHTFAMARTYKKKRRELNKLENR